MTVRGKRLLLNPPGIQTTAAIVAEVEDTRRWKPGCTKEGKPADPKNTWEAEPDIVLQISDCSRAIRLSFGEWDSARNRRVDVQKVDRMIEALEAFRAALLDEQRLYVQRIRDARKA